MEQYRNQTFDSERELYGKHDIIVEHCRFDGPADGESALKECSNIQVSDCLFNLRYPFWHDTDLWIRNSEMTELCRAALWYSEDITIEDTKLHGIKALRECRNVRMKNCDVVSQEFGWSVQGITMEHCSNVSEYFMMRSDHLHFDDVTLKGKYSC